MSTLSAAVNVNELTAEDIEKFIAANAWTVAKTMPQNPHAYIVRAKCTSEELFLAFVIHIRKHGYKVRFGKSIYVCYDVGEYRYWTMGDKLPSTIILNRAKNDPPLVPRA